MGTSASPRHIRVFHSPLSVGGQKIASGCNFTLETFWSPGSRRTLVSPNQDSPLASSHSLNSKDGDRERYWVRPRAVFHRDRIQEFYDRTSCRLSGLCLRSGCGPSPAAQSHALPGVPLLGPVVTKPYTTAEKKGGDPGYRGITGCRALAGRMGSPGLVRFTVGETDRPPESAARALSFLSH